MPVFSVRGIKVDNAPYYHGTNHVGSNQPANAMEVKPEVKEKPKLKLELPAH